MKKILFILSFLSILAACEERTSPAEMVEYDGPIQQIIDAEILRSDSAIITARVTAKRILIFSNGDQEMPDGFFLEFFDKDRNPTANLKGDFAYFNKEQDIWKATGDVMLNNLTKGEKLNTEELFWDQTHKSIFTDKFVRIETIDQILIGEGLTAAEDFSTYKLLKPTGEVILKDLQ